MAVEALLAAPEDPAVRPAIEEGLDWLLRAVRECRHRETAPIGLYFAKLWYHERVYPLAFTVAALGHALRHFPPLPAAEGQGQPASRDRLP